MNKIFKVIWSKSKQCYIVVSEMAKNHSGKKKIVVASILAAMAVGSDALVTDVSAARASVSLAGGNTVTDGTIAIGSGSYSDGTAIGGDGARRVEPGIAIGVDAKAQGNSNIVMGQGAQIIGHSFGVAIGRTAQATDDYGVSVGYNTQADLHGIAMGEQSRAKKTGATSFGVSSRGYGNGAIAVGWQSLAGANVYNENGVPNNDINTDNGKTINDYDKWGDVAIGVRTIATGGNATALGRGATASAANAIAIGGGDGGEPTPAGNTASDNKEKTKATAEKAVAIGYKALASDKNATSIGTDAQATQARATAIGYEVRAVGKNAVAIGSSGENSSRKLNSAGENAISIGTAAQANNLGSTAIGNLALASSNNAVAIGTSAEGTGASSTAIGHLVKATESNAFAAGSESLASGKNSISIGSTFNNITNQSTGEASIAIGAAAQSTGAGSVALGRNVQSLKEYTTAVGMNIKASDNASASTILGYNSYTKANQSVNIGSTVKTEAGGQYSTAIGYTLSVSGKNAIGIGSSDDGIADDKKLMATGESSIAIGTRAQGKASGATAIGKEAVASHTDAIALGTSAQGTGEASTAIGNGAKATNSHAFAAGVGASAAGNSAIAVGNSASAAKDNSVAIGTDTTASEIETVAVGLRASAQGKRSVSLGIDTESTTADGVSVGYLSKSKALGAVAIGRNAVVTAEKSTAVGYDLTVSNSASTNIGYTSTVAANQATSVGARNSVEAGAQYGTALGYFVNISGKNAIGIGSSDDKQNVVASAYNSAAIGTSAQATASSAMALGTNANAALAHSVALGEGSTTTTDDGASKIAYLTNESTNNSGNGVISVGNKRNTSDTGTITRRIVSVAGGTDDFDAVNVKQLKALESKERHIKVKTGNDAYTPDANGKITLNYVNGKGEDVPNEVTEIKDVAKKSDEWTLRTQDGNTTAVATPQTVNGLTKKAVTLKAGDNIAIENNNGVVTIKAKDVVKSVATDNTNALDISNTNGAVKINPKLASSVNAAGEANKLVTAGTVKTALDDKIDKTAEMHIKSGEYTVNTDGTASLIQQNGNNQDQSTRVTIKDIAKKSVVDTLQSDYNTFRTKAITFTGDDNQGVARTLDTTLTVKGGANYTSTTTNTNIRVEKDGTTGLAVKLSDKLTGMKEISGTGSQDLVINNGNTKVTVKAPSNGDNGTVDFGNAKVVASNLDASIKYRANDEAAANAKSVKLADGFNFVASNVTDTATEGPKSGLAITVEDNGKVTFGLDKATREKVDNAADKNLSNLSDTGKDKVKELAKTAAQDAVKVANGINTTVEKDTATAGVTTYKVNANDTTVAVTGDGLAITGGDLGTDKVRKYSLDLSAATKGKLAAVGNLATNVIGGTTIGTDGTVTGPTFSITKADGTAENAGTIKAAIEKLDAANKGQNTKISDTADKVTKLATALGGGAKVENGTFTGPTYNITKADGTGTETASNVGEAITKLDTRITTANGALVTKGLDFTGNDTTDAGKVHRDLGTTLTIKGAENFTRAATETNNIKVVKNGDALDVKLAENLAKMKEISGDGTSDLVIKNGDTKVTVKAPTSGDKGTVDFGDAKVVASNLDANISYKAGNEDTKKKVKLQDGFNFTAATDTAADTNVPKSGLAITTGDNGVVTFGLDKATRSTIDNAADKNLNNLSDTGKNTVKELAKGAAQDAVKVANGINTTVTTDTATTGVTTYKVNANDTTVAVTGDGLAITGGDLGTDKVRKYSLDLSDTVKAKLNAINNVGDTASNGRDGKDGASGAQGLTGKDGLNDKTLTEKVNALRNGEAGSVVYTDENGARLVKAKDGEYYKAADVDKDGNVLNGATPATTVEARLVNPKGETTVPTKLSNIADGKVAAGSKDAVNGGQLNTVKSDLATALGGGAKVENGVFTGPTYNITKADGTGTETASNVGEAITKLDTRITTANGTLVTKGLDFTGNDTTAKVHRDLGTTLTIKGADNFTRTDTETNNIKVVKNNNDLDVKLAKNLGNIQSISNATGAGKPGSTITLGTDGVSIANTAAGQGGAAGDTKTVTIGKDGINAGGMKVTNVADAEKDGDAANKKYVDNAISSLNTTVTNNANLRYAGDTNEGAATGVDHLNLPLATGTLKVAGTADQIKTVANSGTITLSLDEKVTNKLDKLGDTASNGRDGKDGASGAQGLTGKDGLNDKTLTEKVNALRNGEAGSVVYTDENGARLVKAKDGEYYKAADVDKDGNVLNGATPATTVEARLVNPKGETTVPTKLSNIADGKVAAGSKDAVNGGQLNTVKSDLATALGGGAKVENGVFTGPTYNITKADGTGTETASNVGEAITKLDTRITTANGTLVTKGLDFTGNDTTAKVHRDLGTTLTIKGADNFTRTDTETNNIKVVKNNNDLDVKLAENLGNMKEIAGNGKDDLVIKNGDATITLKPKKDAEGINPATPATVDFGNTKVVASNLDASIKYRANDEEAANAKSVKLADGFNFVASNVTDTATEGPKSGLAITVEDNGKVTFGLDKATREKVDNAADKNLSNLTDAGKNKVKELAGEAAKAAVTVADGINTTVTTDTTTAGVTTYKVNANDTTVAVNADTLAISGGTPDATTKVRAYTLDLSNTVKAKLNAINNIGDTSSNGRDGVNGTSGATGLTGKDGLNDKTLTEKVNALRNGEAGSVVYTNDAGDRVVKAKDGKYYKADEVKADGTVKTAEENNGKAPKIVENPQARVVNGNGETTVPTTLSNIADGKVAADSKEAVNGGQLNTVKSDLATALGGGAKVENGVFTGPTYNITKDDGSNTTEAVKNVGDAISKLDGRINNANTTLANKGLDFTGNDTTDAGKVHRNLGETLTIKGADNFTRAATDNNIKVVKNNNDLDVELAENLGNIKEIAGNGKDNLVIKNGDATITLKPKKEAEGTNPATPATVDFGNTKVVAPNLEASITYRANSAEDADAKTVTLQKGLNFVSGDGTAATAEAAKAGITIAADKDGKVVFGLNEATRNAIDNAADKNLSNLSKDGKDIVTKLAKTAAQESVKVASGNNVTVTPETKDGNTTYTVNGRDTTVKAADNGNVSVTGGTLNAKGEREYTVDLTAEAKAELGKISDLNTRLGSAEGKITTLQGDMTKAKDDIANNATHIEANKDLIEANKEAIATNKNAIAANTKDIEANTKDIAANRKDIDANTKDIVANRKDIDANKQGIAENKKQIGENTAAISKNAENIKKNAQDIKKNENAIKSNTDRIQTVENRVTTAEGKIATNEQAIKDNASTIQSNTKAIGANTTAIAKNASDITKANKEIESLKGNSATKDLSNLTNAGKDTITNLINVTGEHGITVTPSTDTTTRVKTFTAKLNDTVTFGSGDKKITVDGTTGTVTSKAVATDTVKANTVNAKTVQLGDSIGTNTTVTADGIAVTTKKLDGTTSKVEIKNGTVSGLTNTKWDPAKVVTEADRSVVATQGQVKDVADTLARGRVFVGDTGKTVTVDLGDTLAIKGGSTKALTDNNIGVVSTEAKDGQPATMTVKLAKDVKMKDGSTSYEYYLPEIKTNPDGSKEIIKNADGSVKYQTGKDGNPIRLVTTTVNGEGITIAPVKGLDKPTVSLTADGLDNGGNQIHNVAAGTANTDAATVGQVRAAAHALNNRVNEAGAHAAALAAMNPLNYDPLKKSQVMAGVGSYKGNSALALGVAHYANEDTLFNVGIAVGDGSNMVNAGVTYRFGGEDSAVPERYKGGPISSVYVMQDEVSALKAENAEMKAQMKMLMERIEMLAAKS